MLLSVMSTHYSPTLLLQEYIQCEGLYIRCGGIEEREELESEIRDTLHIVPDKFVLTELDTQWSGWADELREFKAVFRPSIGRVDAI